MFEPVHAIRAASRQIVRELGVLDDRVGAMDLSMTQGHALMEIEARGCLTSGDLSDKLNLDASTVSRMVGRLMDRGLVTVLEGEDRRSKPLILTPEGKDWVTALHDFADRQVAEALALVPPEKRELMVEGMEAYAVALKKARAQREYGIRPIEARDDAVLGRIIRTVLVEHGLTGEGSAIHDPEVNTMSVTYGQPGSAYFVVERGDRIVGGAGFGPLAAGDGTVAEVRKMYFMPDARGNGMGRILLAKILDEAKTAGYRKMYLETVRHMSAARSLYESFGFRQLASPIGSTGHTACELWYGLTLT